MDKKKLILIISVIVILAGAVFVLGFNYGLRREKQVIVEQPIPAIELLESPLVHTLQAVILGQVTEITDRTLVVSDNNEIIHVPIERNARIVLFDLPGQFIDMAFEDIKINDEVEIIANVKTDGQIQGIHVTARR